jgi:hypothetical protein
MQPKINSSSAGIRQRILFFTLILAISLHFSLGYLKTTTQMVKLDPYLRLDVDTPFRYRILPALIYQGYRYLIERLGVSPPSLNPPLNSPGNWYMILLATASLVGATYVLANAIQHVVDAVEYRWLALLLPFCCYFNYVLVLNRNVFYPYDLPALFFFTLLTYLALIGRYWLFALAFVPAVLTKETAVVGVLLFFLLQARKHNWQRVVAYCFTLLLIFAGTKYVLYMVLNRPCRACAGLVENHLSENLVQLVNPLFWVSIVSLFAYLWIGLALLWAWIAPRLRYAFLITAGIWTLIMLAVGLIREIRVFSELSALLIVLIGSGLHRWLLGRQRSTGEQSWTMRDAIPHLDRVDQPS